jgi:hypothetical protein
MILQNKFLAVIAAALLALHLSTEPSRAVDRNQLRNLGHPNELINQPVCWSAEELDPFRHCDFSERI